MSRLLALLMNIASSQSQTSSMPLGHIVLIVILSPVVILLLAALLGKPRSRKVTGLFLVWLTLIFHLKSCR